MKLVLSPTKSLNFGKQSIITKSTSISFPDKTEKLVGKLKKLSAKQIGNLMNVSANLSDLNFERYQSFSSEFTEDNSKQAILAFTGEVFRGMDPSNFSKKEFDYAQDHIRILSGLYGVLRPLDLIQPYRLEMGTKLAVTTKIKNLYQFWKETTTEHLNKELNGDVLINLASNEYFKSIDTKSLNSDILTLVFKDNKNGVYKSIMTYAKLGRGYMTKYIVKNQVKNIDDIRGFDYEGYIFNNDLSSDWEWVFTRG